jgi:PPOX class probable F420-dependent enzyme
MVGANSVFVDGYVAPMARKDITMTDIEITEFLSSGAKVLQLATIGKGGAPHQAPMWFTMDDGKIVFRSFTKSQKIVNLMRDPRLSVLVEAGDAYAELQGVMIQGTAMLVTDPVYVLKIYGALAARYPMLGDVPIEMDEQSLENAFGRFAPKNTAVIVEPTKVTSWDHTKLGGTY